MKAPIRTILADDHRVFCDGIEQLLTQSSHFVILKKIHQGPQVLETLSGLEVDLLLLDIEIPGMSGLDVLERIRLDNTTTKIVMLSMHDESVYARQAYLRAADGYLVKSIESTMLIDALLRVASGEKHFKSEASVKTVTQNILSNQEMKVLRMLKEGRTSQEISDGLAISILTVKTHRQNMMRKLNVDNIAGLIAQAFLRGIV